MSLEEGRENIKKKLQDDYLGLSEQSKQRYMKKHEKIIEFLFVN